MTTFTVVDYHKQTKFNCNLPKTQTLDVLLNIINFTRPDTNKHNLTDSIVKHEDMEQTDEVSADDIVIDLPSCKVVSYATNEVLPFEDVYED